MPWLFLLLFLIASPALADEQSLFVAKALQSLQQQRNSAMDDAVNAHAKAALLADQVKEQQALIAELQQWIDAAKPKIPAEGGNPK